MITLIIRRFLLMIPMLLLMSVVIFTIAKLQPGDAFTGNMDPKLGQNIMKSNVKNSG